MKKIVVLTFDDAIVNHLTFVVPLLQEYGFGATFFICRCAEWIAEHPECYLSWEDIRKISDAGFEIGNHTVNHVSLTKSDEAVGRRETAELSEMIAAHGIPKPTSFAYPGGPYAPKAAEWLGEYGLIRARTTGKTLWTGKTDPRNIGSWSVNAKEEENLHLALSNLEDAGESCAAVLTYHGVPDIAHPWCDTPPDMFRQHMALLKDRGYQVMSMKDFCRFLAGE